MFEHPAVSPSRRRPPRVASVFYLHRRPWEGLVLYLKLRRDILGTLTETVRKASGLLDVRIGPIRILLLSLPDDIQNVLITQNRAFHKAKGPIFKGGIFGQGLLTTEDEPWRRARRMIQPSFHRRAVAALGDTIVSLTRREILRWQDGEEREMASDMSALAFTIATETLFGFQGNAVNAQVRDGITQAMRYANRRQFSLARLPAWVPTPEARRFSLVCRQLDDVVSRIIEERTHQESAPQDLLNLLMDAVDREGNGFTPQELRDHCLTLLLAGHETTGNALAWTWYLLGQNPGVRAKMEKELSDHLGSASPTTDSLRNLPYLEAVVREAMRLYPPVWAMARRSTTPFRLGTTEYPANVHVIMLPWVVHRDPEWFTDPEEFRPERWLDGSAQNLPAFAYFPFGGGPRLCIARPFALTEIPLVVATICQQFRIHPVAGETVTPEPLVTLRPRRGVRVIIERRRPADVPELGASVAPALVRGCPGDMGEMRSDTVAGIFAETTLVPDGKACSTLQ